MLCSNNILQPAYGNPVSIPTQDMVLGLYYLTFQRDEYVGPGKGRGRGRQLRRVCARQEEERAKPGCSGRPSDVLRSQGSRDRVRDG